MVNICLRCKKTFFRPPSAHAKYCSRKCQGFLRVGKNSPRWKGGKPDCEVCGKKTSKRKYKRCNKCGKLKLIGKIPKNYQLGKTGPNNFNWKGGVTSINKLERAKFISTIRKAVFDRDNYTCQICRQRGGILQVDHIQEWAEYTELRFSMSNCRTLCNKCHYKITYGREMPKNVKAWGQNFKQLERERVVKF